jgi:hypothetical protein
VAQEAEVLPLANLLREKAEHRLRQGGRFRQQIEKVGDAGEPVEVATHPVEQDLLVVGIEDVDVQDDLLCR